MLGTFKDGVKKLADSSGLLGAYHSVRNAQALTVLTLHRVLPPSDPRAGDADPDWSISLDQFADCVAFSRRHFNVVRLEEVLDARRRQAALPPRSLLLTFDDGWADNAEHAVPVLEATNTPATIFVTSSAVGRKAPFWREALRAAWKGGRFDDEIWQALWSVVKESAPPREDAALERLLDRLFEKLTAGERKAALAPFEARLDDGRRHMMTLEQLKDVAARGIEIGAHGRVHEPLSHCEDLVGELVEPRETLAGMIGRPVTTMALPHSRFNAEVLKEAERAGYEIVFTGAPELTRTRVIPFTIGRLAITPGVLSDAKGAFRPDRLALHLFRRRHAGAWS